ncbi:ABC transporter substrate-binding protein [Comamonas testosteroni]|uniref:ABC transporter substrate-binding protein n=1 Tax=Comamonas testosteroni TaxID=285 RepID=A0A373FLX1_COMTE|nr:ABC transporter substrate-binding protein [Comamonas testosteroni]RGE45143.1 ABC transporter substrate-binding protein [Comamonas testosteroni]
MNAQLSRRASLQWLGGAALAAALPAQAQTAAPARRLVSLSGALTEIVYLLNAQNLLVGTDTTSLYPEAAQKTAKVGYVRQLSAEGLLSLRPDAVIGTSDAGPPVVLDQIRQAGVRVALVKAQHNWAEVQEKIKVVGRETGRSADADKLLAQLDGQWSSIQAQVAKAQRKPRVLFVMSHSGSPQVAGKGTAANALMQYAGCVNAIDQFDGYKPLTAEAMASAAPEVIINTTQGIEALGGEAAFWKRPELALTPAFAKKALVTLEASHLLGFGPRLPTAVQALHMRSLQWVA